MYRSISPPQKNQNQNQTTWAHKEKEKHGQFGRKSTTCNGLRHVLRISVLLIARLKTLTPKYSQEKSVSSITTASALCFFVTF